jgi:NitT/TauT family transport system substrate-binding protein
LKGIPVGFIAGGAIYLSSAPTTVLAVAKNAPFQTAKDLEGQTIASITLNSMSVAAVKAWLTQNGADPSTCKFVEVPAPLMGSALARGIIAAATIPEPNLTDARTEVRTFSTFFDAIGKQFMNGGWFTSRKFAAENGPLLHRFVRALYATAPWAATHHAESAAILSKYSKIPVETMNAMTRVVFEQSLDPKMVQPALDIASKYKLLERPVLASELIIPGY